MRDKILSAVVGAVATAAVLGIGSAALKLWREAPVTAAQVQALTTQVQELDKLTRRLETAVRVLEARGSAAQPDKQYLALLPPTEEKP